MTKIQDNKKGLQLLTVTLCFIWSGRSDSNTLPLAPHAFNEWTVLEGGGQEVGLQAIVFAGFNGVLLSFGVQLHPVRTSFFYGVKMG